jgi:cysteine desulfurase / selenocysteine lyase
MAPVAAIGDGFGDFAGRAWLNTAHQGAMPLAAVHMGREAVGWKANPADLTAQRFIEVPQRVRIALGRLINVPADDIVLGNSASYGLHLLTHAYPWTAGDEALVMAGDFPSDILPWLLAEQRFGVRVRRIRPVRYPVTADDVAAAVTTRTRVLCVPWVHSFSGAVADLDALGAVCRDRGVHLVVNGSQAVGARPFDASTARVDALIAAGFKWLCGPYGTGFAWFHPALRERLRRVKAYWLSQLSQADLARDDLTVELSENRGAHEYDIFGTANFANYVPWAVALEHLLDVGVDRVMRHDLALADRLADGLPGAGLTRTGSPGSALVYFSRPDRAANARLHAALTDAGVDVALRGGNLRASPHLYNTTDEIDRLLTVARHTADTR